jgi:hypothetical protein
MPALHARLYAADVNTAEAPSARFGRLKVIAVDSNSIFRPYGPAGSESIRCTNKNCQMLNPPEAKYCWNCGKKLVPKPGEDSIKSK